MDASHFSLTLCADRVVEKLAKEPQRKMSFFAAWEKITRLIDYLLPVSEAGG